MALLSFVITLSVLAVTLLSCISDVKSLRIPNWQSLFILVAFFPAYFFLPHAFGGLGQHLGAMAGMFAVTYAMFAVGMMGGGDSKLGTALGLWAGLNGLLPFIFYMALFGGVLGAFTLLVKKKKFFKNPAEGGWLAQVQQGRNAVPYGVAITFGFWLSLFHTGFMHLQFSEALKTLHG